MIAKTLTYTDFDGTPVTETFHFHLSRLELVEMMGGQTQADNLEKEMIEAARSGNVQVILAMFKRILKSAYGVREGRRFVKNESVWLDFSESPAMDALLFDLMQDPKAAARFVNGLMPSDVSDKPDVQNVFDSVRQQLAEEGVDGLQLPPAKDNVRPKVPLSELQAQMKKDEA